MRAYKEALYRLLSIEYNCPPAFFEQDENRLTVSSCREGRRMYDPTPTPPFFQMVTAGRGSVATADERLHPFLEGFLKDRMGHWLFEQPNLLPLEQELNRFGYTLRSAHHMYLPLAEPSAKPLQGCKVKWFFDEEIHPFYGDPSFRNALCETYQPHRPDRIAVCAYDGDTIVGMAGCSEDAPHWMQIGIDVLPSHRSRGIGQGLVSLLRAKIEENGDIPFYGTAPANCHSQCIAIACGFRPAWVEIGARKRQEKVF
ncbi:MAG: GNAT family N-acetyltransferase [Ruminococcaceae bacterium]|nr:GNAT family N-acetyltransferase [Oscillospiraceae bacterium]